MQAELHGHNWFACSKAGQIGRVVMSKISSKVMTKQKEPREIDNAKAVHTSMQPYHFGMDLLASFQTYNYKNIGFITKRIEENLKSAGALLTTTDPASIFQQSSHWWTTLGKDYLDHYADGLELSHEVKAEIGHLVETEVAISKAKPQEMFDNSPV
jgi:hypothetical protein